MPSSEKFKNLKEELLSLACPAEQQGIEILGFIHSKKLSSKYGLSLREVEILALEQGLIPARYKRNFFALNIEEQIRLLKSNIALAGLGGLGGYAAELSARMGIGRVTATDGDLFEDHNLNRQVLCTQYNLHCPKAKAARERIESVNEGVEFEVRQSHMDTQGFAGLLQDKDLGIDALGGLEVRKNLHEAASKTNVPLVTAAVAGELGYVSTVFPGDTGPLALWEGVVGAEENMGCIPYAVSAIASMQCAEAVHILAGRQPRLRGKMAVLDLQDFLWEIYEL